MGVGLGFEIAQKGYRNRFHSQHGSPTGDWISQIGQDNVYWVFLYGCRGVENSGQVLHSSLQNIWFRRKAGLENWGGWRDAIQHRQEQKVTKPCDPGEPLGSLWSWVGRGRKREGRLDGEEWSGGMVFGVEVSEWKQTQEAFSGLVCWSGMGWKAMDWGVRRQARVGLVTHMDAEVLQSEAEGRAFFFFSFTVVYLCNSRAWESTREDGLAHVGQSTHLTVMAGCRPWLMVLCLRQTAQRPLGRPGEQTWGAHSPGSGGRACQRCCITRFGRRHSGKWGQVRVRSGNLGPRKAKVLGGHTGQKCALWLAVRSHKGGMWEVN